MNIPKIIHRIWLGGDEPEPLQEYAESWREHHPGWEMSHWNDGNVEVLFPLRNQSAYDAAWMLAPNHVGQLRSDLLRYEILFRFGGVYVDADHKALKCIEPLIEDSECFAAWEKQDQWIANGLMGSIPQHWFIDELIKKAPYSIAENPGERVAQMTGPRFLTRMHNFHQGLDAILPEKLIYPYSFKDLGEIGNSYPTDYPEAYTCHAWHNKRRERGLL